MLRIVSCNLRRTSLASGRKKIALRMLVRRRAMTHTRTYSVTLSMRKRPRAAGTRQAPARSAHSHTPFFLSFYFRRTVDPSPPSSLHIIICISRIARRYKLQEVALLSLRSLIASGSASNSDAPSGTGPYSEVTPEKCLRSVSYTHLTLPTIA